jgi:hypothetical protein
MATSTAIDLLDRVCPLRFVRQSPCAIPALGTHATAIAPSFVCARIWPLAAPLLFYQVGSTLKACDDTFPPSVGHYFGRVFSPYLQRRHHTDYHRSFNAIPRIFTHAHVLTFPADGEISPVRTRTPSDTEVPRAPTSSPGFLGTRGMRQEGDIPCKTVVWCRAASSGAKTYVVVW